MVPQDRVSDNGIVTPVRVLEVVSDDPTDATTPTPEAATPANETPASPPLLALVAEPVPEPEPDLPLPPGDDLIVEDAPQLPEDAAEDATPPEPALQPPEATPPAEDATPPAEVAAPPEEPGPTPTPEAPAGKVYLEGIGWFDATPTPALEAPTPALEARLRVVACRPMKDEDDDGPGYIRLDLDGGGPIDLGHAHPALLALTGYEAKYLKTSLEDVCRRYAKALVGRPVPVRREADGFALDVEALLADLTLEAKVGVARGNNLCRCNVRATKGDTVQLHPILNRVLACRACTPVLAATPPALPTKAEAEADERAAVEDAKKRLLSWGLPLSEDKDAKIAARFVAYLEGHDSPIRYIKESTDRDPEWLTWNGRCWERVTVSALRGKYTPFVTATRADLTERAEATTDSAEQTAYREFERLMQRQENNGPSANVLNVLRSFSSLWVERESLDAPATGMLLNAANGTFDLEDGVFRPARKSDFLTSALKLKYDPAAKCPLWERFLLDAMGGDAEMVAFHQRMWGLAATSSMVEEKMFVLFGPTGTGKSTTIFTVAKVLGSYATNLQAKSLALDCLKSIRSDITKTKGKRYVTVSEVPGGMTLDDAMVKQLTSADEFTGERKFENEFDFVPTGKAVVASNEKIEVSPDAMTRVLVVPWGVVFRGSDRHDKRFKQRLIPEYAGILRWIIDGTRAWLREGLRPPAKVLDATAEWLPPDPLESWLRACTDREPDAWTSNEALRASYEAHAARVGEAPLALSPFGKLLTRKGFGADKRAGHRVRLGIALRSP